MHKKFLILFNVFSFLFLFSLTYLDKIVHGDLYNYGLIFDMKWAVPYWVALCTIFVFNAAINFALCLWTGVSLKVSSLIGLSSLLYSINLDVLWFLIADGKLPDYNVIWFWMPQYWMFNVPWNSFYQILVTIGADMLLLGSWMKIWKFKNDN